MLISLFALHGPWRDLQFSKIGMMEEEKIEEKDMMTLTLDMGH